MKNKFLQIIKLEICLHNIIRTKEKYKMEQLFFFTRLEGPVWDKVRRIIEMTPSIDEPPYFYEIGIRYGIDNAMVATMVKDNIIIGYCLIEPSGKEIRSLEIHPHYRGKGYCSVLFTFVLNNLKKMGIRLIRLENAAESIGENVIEKGHRMLDITLSACNVIQATHVNI